MLGPAAFVDARVWVAVVVVVLGVAVPERVDV